MNAVHTEWKAAQAAACRHDTQALPPGRVVSDSHNSDGSSAHHGSTRHWPRTADEAFRTPRWRDPLDGPYRPPNHLLDAVKWLVVVVIALAMVGLAL